MRLWNSKSISSIYILARTRPVFNFAGKTGGQKTCVTVYMCVLRTLRHSQTHTASTPPHEHPPVLCTLSADTVPRAALTAACISYLAGSVNICRAFLGFLSTSISLPPGKASARARPTSRALHPSERGALRWQRPFFGHDCLGSDPVRRCRWAAVVEATGYQFDAARRQRTPRPQSYGSTLGSTLEPMRIW